MSITEAAGVAKRLPELRFPEFEGEWRTGKLSQFSDIIDGDRGANYPKADDFSSEGFCLFLNAKNVTKRGFEFNEVMFIASERDKLLGNGKTQRSDVILTTRGSVGNFAIVDASVMFENMRINSGMVILRPNQSKLVSQFLYVQSSAANSVKHIQAVAFGSAQPQLTVGEIKKFPINLPTLPEQKKIAAFLGVVDAKITALKERQAGFERYKRGMMQALFSQTLRFTRPDDTAFPDWEEKRLGDDATIDKGQQLNRDDMIKNAVFPVINGGVTPSGFTDRPNTEGDKITISEGGNSCGFVGYQGQPFWCGGHCYVISPKTTKLDNTYLLHALKFVEASIMRLRVGSGLPNIQKGDLSKVVIPLPHLDEQTKIADALCVIDAKIAAVSDQVGQMEQLKKGLLQQMFV